MPYDASTFTCQGPGGIWRTTGALVGLDDEALDRCPEAGEWSIREILERVFAVQRFYLELILKARAAAQPVERD